jgi:hypothetical protein
VQTAVFVLALIVALSVTVFIVLTATLFPAVVPTMVLYDVIVTHAVGVATGLER